DEGRSAPERERVAQLSVRSQARKALEIELVRLDMQHVTGGFSLETVPADGLPQLRDIHLERLVCLLRRLVVPERIEKTVGRDDAIRVEQQHCQERPMLLSAEVEAAVVLARLQRAEDSEVHLLFPNTDGGASSSAALGAA